jgi:hypothetical protein
MATQVTQILSPTPQIVTNFGWWFENGSTATTWVVAGIPQTPLNTPITFDATGKTGLTYLGGGSAPALPSPSIPSGLRIVSYLWNFGNGDTGIGSTALTTFTYPIAISGYAVSLTITDSLGRQSSASLQINLNGETLGFGSMRERQGTARGASE